MGSVGSCPGLHSVNLRAASVLKYGRRMGGCCGYLGGLNAKRAYRSRGIEPDIRDHAHTIASLLHSSMCVAYGMAGPLLGWILQMSRP